MKVVSLKRLGDLEQELTNRFPDVEFLFTKGVNEIAKSDRSTLDILIGYDSNLDESFLTECPNLKWIAWYATGVNKLPLNYIANQNILLTNGKGIHVKQMAEFITAFILDDYKKMRTSYINQQNKVYDSKLTADRVGKQTVLFLGTGTIAQRTAHVLQALDMNILGINTTGHKVNGINKTYALKELLSVLPEADIVVNTLPETDNTIHLLTSEHFSQMKNTALFINVGRGSIVKEDILIKVLKDSVIRHAYLDVFEKEPLMQQNELFNLSNVTITAHITGNGKENFQEATDLFTKNLTHFLNNNHLIENEVDAKQGY
ncbi:hydroxyacid dehydrogenase [Staphylococcus gallinarum]|uniref:phosphoglycerate dehydrogenase n=1 Tax=Staphylococcus gallinarum TaxID=1293 RepID=UPI000D1C911D|nr:phosphoglycerate dehydrogenase [Staphylococcus gallinarum]MBU7217415.1 phosphoglycerate dehydrogenase [Staphylococcus gallinarum]PTE33016.1 hydroxyacid dehydrogenase [Staphylococcus gallinarum]